MSDDAFDDLMAGIEKEEVASEPAKKSATKRKAVKQTPKQEPKDEAMDQAVIEAKRKAAEAVAKASDTAIPDQGAKSTWPVVEIDEIKGSPNFHFVQVNGIPFQVKRGEPVAVPPAVLDVLQNAVGHRVVQEPDPSTGQTKTRLVRYATVPYRIVSWKR